MHDDDHREAALDALRQRFTQSAGDRAVLGAQVQPWHRDAAQQGAQAAFELGAELANPAEGQFVVGMRIADEGGVLALVQGG